MIQVFRSSIDLTFTMVIENGRQNRLKSKKKLSFWIKIWRFNRQVYKEHKQIIPKMIFKHKMIISKIHKILLSFWVFSCADIYSTTVQGPVVQSKRRR